jgi:hypothetical protein
MIKIALTLFLVSWGCLCNALSWDAQVIEHKRSLRQVETFLDEVTGQARKEHMQFSQKCQQLEKECFDLRHKCGRLETDLASLRGCVPAGSSSSITTYLNPSSSSCDHTVSSSHHQSFTVQETKYYCKGAYFSGRHLSVHLLLNRVLRYDVQIEDIIESNENYHKRAYPLIEENEKLKKSITDLEQSRKISESALASECTNREKMQADISRLTEEQACMTDSLKAEIRSLEMRLSENMVEKQRIEQDKIKTDQSLVQVREKVSVSEALIEKQQQEILILRSTITSMKEEGANYVRELNLKLDSQRKDYEGNMKRMKDANDAKIKEVHEQGLRRMEGMAGKGMTMLDEAVEQGKKSVQDKFDRYQRVVREVLSSRYDHLLAQIDQEAYVS